MIELLLTFALHMPTTELPIIERGRHEAQMNDVHERDSSYTGRFYYADQEPYRQCVAEREANGRAWARGGGGDNYYGTYQFSLPLWRGATYMMTPELKREYGDAKGKHIAVKLRALPPSKVATRWQTQAFYTVLNWEGKWSGKSHWKGGRWTC